MRKLIVSLLPFVLLTLPLPSSPALAVEEVLQAGSVGDPLALETQSGRLLRGDGSSLQVPAPEGAVFSDLAVHGGAWTAAASYRDDEGIERLFVVRGSDTGPVETLRPPRRQSGLLRQGAVLLVDGDRLVGMAWLEGDENRALEVRAARWNGRRFRGVHRVAGAGPGSQLALTGAVLADGSWLLAWTAFDGQDDEVVWTQRVGRRWLPPTPVAEDNGVPDITPSLAACGTGAVLAWSRYDGNDYRLKVARFQSGAWEEPSFTGAAGSLYPSFVANSGGAPHLVYRQAGTGGWNALELDAAGSLVQRAEVAPAPRQRPVVASTGEGLTFRWAGEGASMSTVWLPVSREEAP